MRKVGRIGRHLAEEIYILDSLLRKLFPGGGLYDICFRVACNSRFRFLWKCRSSSFVIRCLEISDLGAKLIAVEAYVLASLIL
jgi:hypothetical protein